MIVGVARFALHIAESGSLKGKRQVLRRVLERVKARFNVSIAEVGEPDLWQVATLACAVVGGEARHVNEQLEKILRFVEEMYVAEVVSKEVELLTFDDQGFRDGGGGTEASVPLMLPTGERSMAEAEGLGSWKERFGDSESGPAQETGPGRAEGRAKPMDPEQRRSLSRRLRNPREWEKE